MRRKMCHCSNPSTPLEECRCLLERLNHDVTVVLVIQITKFRVAIWIVIVILPNLDRDWAIMFFPSVEGQPGSRI